MSESQVSVVIIFLNGEQFLAEAIDSVRLQTHHGWELILVDDGSTDRSAQIAREAAASDPSRIRLVQHADGGNHGTSASRNLGATHAHGQYLLFLDCDDLLFRENLERHAQVLDAEHDIGAVFSPTLFWLWDPRYADDVDSLQSVGSFGGRRIVPPGLLIAMLEDESLHPANCGTLFRRTAFDAAGGFDETFRGMYEDTAMLTKLLLQCPTFMVPECLSAYRVHQKSQCNSARDAGEYDPTGPSSSRRHYLEWARSFVSRHAPASSQVLAALERELKPQGRSRLGELARRVRRKLHRLAQGRRPVLDAAHSAQPSSALRQIQLTYQAMNREVEAAAVEQRIAQLASAN